LHTAPLILRKVLKIKHSVSSDVSVNDILC